MTDATSRMISPTYNFKFGVHIYKGKDGQVSRYNPDHEFRAYPNGYDLGGIIPGWSTVSGAGRTLLGLIDVIRFVFRTVFCSKRKTSLEALSLSAHNVVRGLVEMVPLVGNAIMLVGYQAVKNDFQKQILADIKKTPITLPSSKPSSARPFMPGTIHSFAKDRDRIQMDVNVTLGGKQVEPPKPLHCIVMYKDAQRLGVYTTEDEFNAALSKA